MYPWLALTLVICGVMYIPFAVMFLGGKNLGILSDAQNDESDSFDQEACARFLGNVCLTVMLICFCGAALSFFELLPIPVICVFFLTPAASAFSALYVSKSKRFKKETK